MNKSTHILVVDDDRGIRDLLGRFLRQHGFKTSLAENGEQMQEQLKNVTPDLIILDVMLPGDDGMTLCRKLRHDSSIPVIMLTAVGEDVDRILGLEMGADDYISKPFNPRELLARIKAVLRRYQSSKEPVTEQHSRYRFDEWLLDKTARRLSSADNMEISLSTGEYNLLLAFLDRPKQVLSRDHLLDLTKNRTAAPFDRSVDIQISRLRQKIERDHKSPQLIKTVRGGGYVLATDVERL